jgi:hypothetical protein
MSKKNSTFAAENVILWHDLYAENVICAVFYVPNNVI